MWGLSRRSLGFYPEKRVQGGGVPLTGWGEVYFVEVRSSSPTPPTPPPWAESHTPPPGSGAARPQVEPGCDAGGSAGPPQARGTGGKGLLGDELEHRWSSGREQKVAVMGVGGG